MKKRIIMIIMFIIILLMIGYLYNTFALSSIITDDNDSYSIVINGSDSIEIDAKSSKTIYYKITNSNNGKVKYGVGYTGTDVIVKVYEESALEVSGIMNYGENKFIKLKLINNGTTTNTITLKTILGYENGGDLIVPSGYTLITEKVSSNNVIRGVESSISDTSKFLNTDVVRNTIETLTVTNNNVVPMNVLGSFDISQNGDGSIMMWYTDTDNNSLYEVYIGSDDGVIKLPNGSSRLFAYLSNVTSIDLRHVDATNTTSMTYMFYNCSKLVNLDLSNFKTPNLLYFNDMFNGCSSLTFLDLSGFDTSRITNFSNLFRDCSSLKEINLSSFNTSSATLFPNVFRNCKSLESLDLSNFNTSNVTSMISMFSGCSSLTSLDLSNFDTSKVTNMGYGMFYNCNKLISLDLSNFDTSKATDMADMFSGCSSLTNINLSSFDTSKVTNMSNMFYKCSSLSSLDLSSFNTSNVTNMYRAFMLCDNLTTIYVSDLWSMTNVTNSTQMFQSSTKIKGNVSYDWSKVDGTMANYTSGYLTYKKNS